MGHRNYRVQKVSQIADHRKWVTCSGSNAVGQMQWVTCTGLQDLTALEESQHDRRED